MCACVYVRLSTNNPSRHTVETANKQNTTTITNLRHRASRFWGCCICATSGFCFYHRPEPSIPTPHSTHPLPRKPHRNQNTKIAPSRPEWKKKQQPTGQNDYASGSYDHPEAEPAEGDFGLMQSDPDAGLDEATWESYPEKDFRGLQVVLRVTFVLLYFHYYLFHLFFSTSFGLFIFFPTSSQSLSALWIFLCNSCSVGHFNPVHAEGNGRNVQMMGKCCSIIMSMIENIQ